jgi:hypothetical protein
VPDEQDVVVMVVDGEPPTANRYRVVALSEGTVRVIAVEAWTATLVVVPAAEQVTVDGDGAGEPPDAAKAVLVPWLVVQVMGRVTVKALLPKYVKGVFVV